MDGTKQERSRKVSVKTVILALVLAAVVPSIIFQQLLMIMYVPSESMYPTMTAGDTLLGTRVFSSFDRGSIVAFQTDTVVMIKRVIGLPGEEVFIDEKGIVYINGSALDEPYIENHRSGKTQSFSVPEGCVLLLGDNRTDSYDARYWDNPYVEVDAILAVAKIKFFEGKLEG